MTAKHTRALLPGAIEPAWSLVGPIDQAKVRQLHRVLRAAKGPFTIAISSHGGDPRAALEMFELLRLRRGDGHDVMTVGIGSVLSAAVLVLVGGSPGQRVLTRHSRLMYHGSRIGGRGLMGELRHVRRTVAALTDHDRTFDKLVAEATGNTLAAVRRLYRQGDCWLTPRQAKAMGFVDRVI